MASIAIVADSRDEHQLKLRAEIERRSVAVVLLAPDAFPASVTLSLRAAPLEARWTMESSEIVALHNVDRAFIRHSAGPKAGSWSADPALRTWTVDEATAALDALLLLLPIRFVPASPTVVRTAACKPLQIARAAECGLAVPRTLMTNDPTMFARFFEETEGQMVSKTLFARQADVDGVSRFAFTHAVQRRDLTNLNALRNGPVLLQERIAKRRELRVTIAGDSVFAAEVDSQAVAATRVDWRRLADPPLVWQPHHLPVAVHSALLRLMQRLDLSFGCVDMILTHDDEHVFLEVNPLGDWLFIEERLGSPITSAIADLLTRADR